MGKLSAVIGEPSRYSHGFPSALLSIAVGVIAAVLAIVRATVPRFAGQAPHPDGDRYLCQLGSDTVEPVLRNVPRYWDYALLQWQHTGIPQQTECVPYPSSQVWVLRALEWFSSAVSGRPGTLDFHWLVIANGLIIGLVVGLFAAAADRASLAVRLLGSGAMLLILSDPVFTAYAAGPMGEYVGLLGIALLAVGIVYYSTEGRQWWGSLIVAIGGWLAVTSKVQMVTVLLPLAAMLLWIPLSRRRSHHRAPGRRVERAFTGRIVGALLVAALAASAGWMLSNNPKEFQRINPWELISVGILGPSATPANDLAEMGFPREMAKYAGKTAGDENSVMFTPEWREYAHLMTYGTVAKFLLAHPDRVWPLINTGAHDFFVAQPAYLGANEPGSGPPKKPAFSLIAAFGTAVNSLSLFVFGMAFAFGFSVIGYRRSRLGSPARGFANAALLMAAFTVVQFVTAVFGEAIENTKHLVFAILSSALVVPLISVSMLAGKTALGASPDGLDGRLPASGDDFREGQP